MNNKHITYTPHLKRWSWGAFFLTWIWGIRCKVWNSFLCFIPGFGLVWRFILGAKGRKWAWEKGNWKNEEHFEKVQDRWDIAGMIIFIVWVVLNIAICAGAASGV